MAKDRYFKLESTSGIDTDMVEYYIGQFIASGAIKDVTDEWERRQDSQEVIR